MIAGDIKGCEDFVALRRFTALTQEDFATALGISVHTLRNWGQDRRKPEGPAMALLRIAARHPHVLKENLAGAGHEQVFAPMFVWGITTADSLQEPLWCLPLSRESSDDNTQLISVECPRSLGMARIYVDADACPVKNDVYAIGKRLNLVVHVVANQWMHMPDDPMIRLEVVDDGFDAADHWIVDKVGSTDVVVTDDILLAGRCIDKGARVITNRGIVRDANNIGEAIAMRELMQFVRASGDNSGNQKPMDEPDRRRFRHELDKLVHATVRNQQ